MRSNLDVQGNVVIVTRCVETGAVRMRQECRNRVVLRGRNLIRNLMTGSGTPPSHMAIGFGVGAVLDSDTQLNQEAVPRHAFTDTILTSSSVTYRAFWAGSQGNGGTIREAGIFNNGATETDDMLARVVIPAFTKDNTITLTIDWVITFGAAS